MTLFPVKDMTIGMTNKMIILRMHLIGLTHLQVMIWQF